MAEFKITRSELQKVYRVACPDWKDRIIQMLEEYGDPFSTSITLPEKEVRQMFEAATSDQTRILREVFPDWEDQGPVRNLSKGEEKRVNELLQELSTLLFGDIYELELAKGWADYQPELRGKTIGVPNFGVRLHKSKVASGVTLIEFTEKIGSEYDED